MYVMPFELGNNLMMIPERWEMGQAKVDPYISYGERCFTSDPYASPGERCITSG